MTSEGGSPETSQPGGCQRKQLLLFQPGPRIMLMFLFNDIPSICHLLLVPLFLITTKWIIQTIKEFRVPGSKKKSKKYLAPCLTSLQGTRDKGTDPERSSEDLDLEYTLRTLDRNIQYLAWQLQRIAGPTACSSSSNTSLDTVMSLCSSTHSSAGSRSRTPPSLAPAALGKDVQCRQPHHHLIRPPGAGLQQVRLEAPSHRKVNFNIRQKQLEEQWGGPTPHSESLTRLIPSAPKWHPATHRTNPDMQIRAARILSYKEQELLNWHIQKKHQKEEADPLRLALVATGALTGNDRTQAGGTMHWVTQQPLLAQQPRSHTPPQSNTQGRRTPPRSPRMQSPGPCARPPIPLPPAEGLPPPALLICKEETRSNAHESVEVKVSGRTPKKGLVEMLTMYGQSKSPTLRESGRPGSPKEKKKDSHSPARRPASPKEDLGKAGKVGSPKDKQAEVKVSLRPDQTMHTLSWTNMPEFLKPSLTREQPAAAQPKFLDPSFMCQNQLELPCIAAAREEQNQKSYPFAQFPLHPTARTPKPQCLAHTIVQSLDTEQAMRDLQMHLAKGLETGHGQPSVEYPLCLLCGRCTPYCPHPPTRHSPRLLVYPRLDVRDGGAYMTLGFLLKLKRSEADKWGLTQVTDVLMTPCDKERPSKREKSRRTTPPRKSHARATGPRPSEPKTPHVVKEHFLQSGDRKTRNPVVTRQAARVIATPAAPATPQTSKAQFQPPPARPPPRPARPPPPAARPPPPAARPPPPKTSVEPPSILKQLLSAIKRIWARVRQEAEKCPERCSKMLSPEKSSPSKKSGTPLSAPISPKPGKEPGPLSLESPASGTQMKGDISNARQASPLLASKQEASPFKSAAPRTSPKVGTAVVKPTSFAKHTSPKDRKGVSLRFKEPDSPWASKKGPGSHKRSASPRTPKKSPSLLRRTPSRQSTLKVA